MKEMNPTQLKIRLEYLLNRLEIFDSGLEDNFRYLDTSWSRLDEVWGGMAREDFSRHWEETRAVMRNYLSLCHRYETFLRDRIASLEKLERTGGELS